MNIKVYGFLIISLTLFFTVSVVNAHGADLTEDTMIIANETNGITAKTILDEAGLDIKVYKFVSEGDVEHQLEHAQTNPNKKILAISYQDSVNSYLSKHPELKKRVIVSEDDNASIIDNSKKLISIDVNTKDSTEFIIPLVVGLVIGTIIGLVGGVLIMKRQR